MKLSTTLTSVAVTALTLSNLYANAEEVVTTTTPVIENIESQLNSNMNMNMDMMENKFSTWLAKHAIEIIDKFEYQRRLFIFWENDKLINLHNAIARRENTFTLGHNEFSHYTQEEFRHLMVNGINTEKSNEILVKQMDRKRKLTEEEINVEKIADFPDDNHKKEENPVEIDWVAEGAVQSVKNQGQCGACWAFAAAGALEGAYYLKTGKSVDFSEQELLDCEHVDAGCNGGWMDNAYSWIKTNGGLCTDGDYPYRASSGLCRKSMCSTVAESGVNTWVDIEYDEEKLETAVAQQPVAAAMEASTLEFQFYSSGVFTGNCGQQVDHGVLIVGYGVYGEQNDKIPYWKVKNSWGDSWGMDGYFMIQKGIPDGGKCGISLANNYPIMN